MSERESKSCYMPCTKATCLPMLCQTVLCVRWESSILSHPSYRVAPSRTRSLSAGHHFLLWWYLAFSFFHATPVPLLLYQFLLCHCDPHTWQKQLKVGMFILDQGVKGFIDNPGEPHGWSAQSTGIKEAAFITANREDGRKHLSHPKALRSSPISSVQNFLA